MAGFKDQTLNTFFRMGSIDKVISHLIACSAKMKNDCLATGNLLPNNEDKITNRLVSQYLNTDTSLFIFDNQVPENFDPITDTYIGRADIRVLSKNQFARSKDCYYLIECKRISGDLRLNKKYITDGVSRFVSSPVKYSSHHKQNIMFAYIVRTVSIGDIVLKISALQKALLNDVVSTDWVLVEADVEHFEYKCGYFSEAIQRVELRHLFYDISDVIRS